jgi:hypothetical protein
VSDPAPSSSSKNRDEGPAKRRRFYRGFIYSIVGILVLFIVALGPVGSSIKQGKHTAAMQQGRMIGQAMFSYAADNVQNGNVYPDGNSSTEVFQKLLDGNYVTDPVIFYVPLPGKVKAVAGQKLKPENVSWDVTSGVDSRSSDFVPLVFMTGYRVTYAGGSSAVPVIQPYPQYWPKRTWTEWWNGTSSRNAWPGIEVFYKGNNAVYRLMFQTTANSNYAVTNFVSPDFQGDGHSYRQLTPTGPLAP